MIVYQNADGAVVQSCREYDIASGTAIKAGQVVDLAEGLVTAHAAAGTGAMLGVAAENHSGAEDALDPRANGTKIKVYDGPHQMFRCAAPVLSATGGSATTLTAICAGAADAYNGGYLKLIEKAADSTNADPVGKIERITDFATASGTGTFTKASGGTPCAGDKYALFLPVGFQGGNLDANGQKLVVTATAAIPIKVAGRVEGADELVVMSAKHALAVTV